MKRLLLALFIAAGCQPTSQVILHVDTDAVVPAGPGMPPVRSWQFDRLRIELVRGDAPAMDLVSGADATRDFAVDEQQFAEGRVSMGFAPPIGDDGLAARVRLYRSGRLSAGQPVASSTIDARVALPPVAAQGSVDLTVRLHVEDIGLASHAVDPEPGPPGPSEVNSWPGAAEVACGRSPGDDEVCVPGGAFFLGDPIMRAIGDGLDADRERLVVVSPFFLQLHEVTVGELRARWPALSANADEPFPKNATGDTSVADAWCTWTAAPGSAEDERMPLDCVDFRTAAAYCKALGGELPTAAQLEFLASGRGEERGYAWGEDEPACGDAVFGRGGVGFVSNDIGTCLPAGSIGGILPGGSGARDRIALSDGNGGLREVVDLAANLSEWTRDRWSRQTEAFWSRPGVFRDPVPDLVSPADGDQRTVYGGSWYLAVITLRAAYRQPVPADISANAAGFRCARAGK